MFIPCNRIILAKAAPISRHGNIINIMAHLSELGIRCFRSLSFRKFCWHDRTISNLRVSQMLGALVNRILEEFCLHATSQRKAEIAQLHSHPLTQVDNHLASVSLTLVRVPSSCWCSLCELCFDGIHTPSVLVEQWALTEGFQVRLPSWVMIHPTKTLLGFLTVDLDVIRVSCQFLSVYLVGLVLHWAQIRKNLN